MRPCNPLDFNFEPLSIFHFSFRSNPRPPPPFFIVLICYHRHPSIQLHPGAAGDRGAGPRDCRQLHPGGWHAGAPRAAEGLQRRRLLLEAGGAGPSRFGERGVLGMMDMSKSGRRAVRPTSSVGDV